MVENPDTVTRYRNRAEELRVIAATLKDKKRREDMGQMGRRIRPDGTGGRAGE